MRCGFVLAALVVLAAPARAQHADSSRADTGSVVGVVRTGDRVPVEGARVRDARTGRVALSDREGHFQLRGLPAGLRLVDVMAIGYGMATGEVEVRRAQRTELQVTLEPLPRLDTIIVTSEGPINAPREFVERMREGHATRIFTADEIAQRAPVYTSRLLALVPGVRVVGDGPRATIVPGRGATTACARVYLDGYLMRPDEVNAVAPSTLAGVEFYYAQNAPPQYVRGGACAVVLLWTKVRRDEK